MYTTVTPLQDALTRDIRSILYLLWGGAGFVLLIGAINIANLSLVRARMRARELATRLSLGARRLQVTRQLIIEGLVPAAIGGVAAAGVGAAILRALTATGVENLPNAAQVRMDTTTFAFVGAVCGLVGVLIGLVPAITVGGLTINHVLADGSRLGTSGRATRLFGRALVVTQVALSVVLLIGATLLLTSFRHLLRVDPGFTAARVTTATVFPPPSRYPDAPAVDTLVDRFLEAVRAIPGVEAAGITSNVALSGYASPATVAADHDPAAPPVIPSVIAVTPGYFEAMATRLVRGRYFAESDRSTTLRVAILDERLAARLWPNQDPIGKGVYRGDAGPYTIVGVVREVRFEGLTERAESIGTAYFRTRRRRRFRDCDGSRSRQQPTPHQSRARCAERWRQSIRIFRCPTFRRWKSARRVRWFPSASPWVWQACSGWSRCFCRCAGSTACSRMWWRTERARSAFGWRSAAPCAASFNSCSEKAWS